MRKIVSGMISLALLAAVSGGCAAVTSAMGGNTNETGEAWWVKSTGMGPLIFYSKVFYCPAPANGPAQCKEAKMVEGAGK